MFEYIFLGALGATYVQNPKFRAAADKVVKDIMGKGIDLVNRKPVFTEAKTPAKENRDDYNEKTY